jgi:uncharacterized protein (TIGR01244 family)
MDTNKINPEFSTGGPVKPSDLADLKTAGYSDVICTRPDDEEPGQTSFATIRAAAEAAGLKAHHVPIKPGQATDADVAAFGAALDGAKGKVHAYCKSGGRALGLYQAART